MLGPLVVADDGHELPLGGNKLRVVLSGLLLRPGETVPATRLAAWLWEGEIDDPDRAKATVHSYVNRLRRQPGLREVVRTVQDGYRAEVDAGSLDLLRFRALARSGRTSAAAGDLVTAARDLSAAIGLWRGPVLSNVDSAALHAEEAGPVTEEWLLVQEQWLDVGLRTGRHADLVPALRELTRSHPLREPFWERLLLALHRGGRHAEALQAYHAVSELLSEELGVDPGPSLRATYQAILTDDPALGPTDGARAEPVPRQLRPDIPGFAGRRAELASLDRLLESTAPSPGPRIVSLQGTAGSGKTALAIHWAHRVRDHFPDGQLYLDLHGYGPQPPVDPATALETLLRGLGTPAARIPTGLDERAALFRTLLNGRRMLVLLDNAGSSDQVRPLMPGSDGLVVVTSRNQLRGLVVQHGARRVVLDLMPAAEAAELLSEVLGRERVAADPEAVREIVQRCARLPLALRIFAERAARFPGVRLGKLVADLRDERTRLAALDTGDGDDTDLRMVFSWTYGALEPGSARLFRLLGLHPGSEVSTGAAAALAGTDVAAVSRSLDRLTADHLLRSRSPGRYDFHDLLRDYAAERARADADQDSALRRMLDWYLHTAGDAARHLPPGGRPFFPGPAPADVTPLAFADAEDAVEWYEEELPNLMAAAHLAAARGRHDLAWRLPRVLASFLDFHVPGAAWAALYQVAARSSGLAGEPLEEGLALNHLALVLTRLGRVDEAVIRHGEALELARRTGDRDLEGDVLVNLGTAYFRLGRLTDSSDCYGQALDIAREIGDRRLEAEALDDIAQNDNEAGRHAEALAGAGQALTLYTALGDRHRSADALRILGVAHTGLGEYGEAAQVFQRALDLMRESEDRRGEADLLSRLGDAVRESGDLATARSHWRAAAAIFTALDDARADALQRRLAETISSAPGRPTS
ncbi:BTAD domain-containing putative transcriptional regulator [Streptosporangium soli]|nr:tetratricopeptide repeat protein [Streptosporangium sp. KLBMP 9127]